MSDWFKGKGAQFNPSNKFLRHHYDFREEEYLDEKAMESAPGTQVFFETPKKAVSRNQSPDLNFVMSINPYQGCEHGCIYCYARPTHEYWGFSSGLDFESKIIVKKNLPNVLRREFHHPKWKVSTIMLSGNTDCYQPLERKHRITRSILELMLEFRHPVGILTKNTLVTRDLDIIQELARLNLIHVGFSMTSLDEKVRREMEPRTGTVKSKLKAIELFASHDVPVMIMAAPIIPGLNDHELPGILKATSDAGARFAGYTIVRLNGTIAQLSRDWFEKRFPDRAKKIWKQVESLHGGNVHDSYWGRRLRGDGKIAETINQLFKVSNKKYFGEQASLPKLRKDLFRRGGTYNLFSPS